VVFLYLSLFVVAHGGNTVLNEKSGISFCSKLLRFHLSAGNEGDVSTLRSHQRAFRRTKNRFCKLGKEAKIKGENGVYMRECRGAEPFLRVEFIQLSAATGNCSVGALEKSPPILPSS
jgi:hypothetical protein